VAGGSITGLSVALIDDQEIAVRGTRLRRQGENSMNSNDLVISTEGLSKPFGEVHALKSLDLHVPQKANTDNFRSTSILENKGERK